MENTAGQDNGFMASAMDSRLQGAGLSLGQDIVLCSSTRNSTLTVTCLQPNLNLSTGKQAGKFKN